MIDLHCHMLPGVDDGSASEADSLEMGRIAARSGVSIATVSKHINGIPVKEENRLRINEAIAALGYRVNSAARTLKTRRSMTVGVLLDSLSNLFYTSVISEAEELLQAQGYTSILFETQDSLDLFSSKSVDGILYLSSRCRPEILARCARLNIPLTVVDSITPDASPACDFVVTENARGAFSAVEYLQSKGHRDIGVITGSPAHFSANERLRGYRNALAQAAIPLREEWVLRDEYNIDGGHRCTQRLLQCPQRPTALLICNYFMTIGAVMALNEANISIPDGISVVSFDEIELIKAMKPRLTTVNQQISVIAARAVERLIARITGQQPPETVQLIPTVLVERDSVTETTPRPAN